MLSGNVNAVLAAGTLSVTALPPADSSDNSIELWQAPNPGEFWVAGAAGTATLVNSGTAAVQFTNVQDIVVRLGPGSDTFQFLSQGGSGGPGTVGGNAVRATRQAPMSTVAPGIPTPSRTSRSMAVSSCTRTAPTVATI